MKKSILLGTITLFSIPSVVLAAPGSFRELVELLLSIFNTTIVPLIFAISFLVFIWGVAQYAVFPGGEDQKTKGKQIIVWGIVGFFFMVSVWGIVNLIAYSFFFDLSCLNNSNLFGCYPF